MRLRAISSVFVVIVGLVAVAVGGPVFGLLLIIVGATGYREYLMLVAGINPKSQDSLALVGFGVIVALGLTALLDLATETLFAVAVLAVFAPLTLLVLDPIPENAFALWTQVSVGSLYLGLPVYAAITLRSVPGSTEAWWLTEVATRLSAGWDVAPRGLAWALIVILTTWVGDTTAYIVGRTWGRRKMAPAISPNKTIEGSGGGIIGSTCVCALTFQSFGLGPWWLGLIIGGAIGVAGQTGDLAESFLKRQAGVKDSGTMIPGHGGMLDRIDALLFAFPVGFVIATGFEWIAS